jgi:bisphosphoglycerate-dependent phosphoglycerate mutase
MENDKVFVFPYLNEIYRGGDYENLAGRMDNNGNIIRSSTHSCKYSFVNDQWIYLKKKDTFYNYQHILDFPIMDTIDLKKNNIDVPKNFSHISANFFWYQLLSFINSKIKDPYQFYNFFIVTHHHKLKKILNIRDDKGIATGCCMKIDFSKENNQKIIPLNIIFKGFPDKVSEIKQRRASTGSPYNIEKKKRASFLDIASKKISEKEYSYYSENEIIYGNYNNIQIDLLLDKLKKNMNINIFIIRHGNSMHNKPLKLTGPLYNRNTDTNLTPLGNLQALSLGIFLKKYIDGHSKYDNIYISSCLNRAQHSSCAIASILNPKYIQINELYKFFNILSILRMKRKFKRLIGYKINPILLLLKENKKYSKKEIRFLLAASNNCIEKKLKSLYSINSHFNTSYLYHYNNYKGQKMRKNKTFVQPTKYYKRRQSEKIDIGYHSD